MLRYVELHSGDNLHSLHDFGGRIFLVLQRALDEGRVPERLVHVRRDSRLYRTRDEHDGELRYSFVATILKTKDFVEVRIGKPNKGLEMREVLPQRCRGKSHFPCDRTGESQRR